jgi:hypothetical protein
LIANFVRMAFSDRFGREEMSSLYRHDLNLQIKK